MLFGILWFLSVLALAAAECPPDVSTEFDDLPGVCYSFHSKLAKFMAAKSHCKSFGAQLITLKSAYIDAMATGFATEIFHSSLFYWTGGNNLLSPPDFKWPSGENFTAYDHFRNGTKNGSCVSVEVNQGYWKADNCYSEYSFICEFPDGKGIIPLDAVPLNSPPAEPKLPTLDDQISMNSTFPNGSSIATDSGLKDESSTGYAPLEVSIEELTSLGVKVDNSSFVAETSRQSFFFVRLPPFPTGADANASTPTSIGIRFGNSSILNLIPLNLTAEPDSGISVVGTLPDKSTVYQVKVRMGEMMCEGAENGACNVISWKPYSVSDSNISYPANFSISLPVACGSQCDMASDSPCATSSCTPCDGKRVAGQSTPVTRRYKMSSTSGNLTFAFQTFQARDRIKITYEDETVYDSTCTGTGVERKVPVSYSGKTTEIRVDVEPNCDGTTSTEWYFELPCPQN